MAKEKPKPLKLLRNKTYPSYQLYAIAGLGKLSSESVFKFVILETVSWLKQRFREFEIPEELNVPNASDYEKFSLHQLHSFCLDRGYKVEVLWLPEDFIWTLQLTEPDLGPEPGKPNQKRQPVPGRIFETNIAYRITDKGVECGFKTRISEPETTNIKCEVFRLAFIKRLVREPLVGLKQIWKIADKPFKLDSTSTIKSFKRYLNHKNRMLPLLVVAESAEGPLIDDPRLSQMIRDNYNNISYLERNIINMIPAKPKPMTIKHEFPININKMARYRLGYAQFFTLPSEMIEDFNKIIEQPIENGDVVLFEPIQFGGKRLLFSNDPSNHKLLCSYSSIDKMIQNYPKGKVGMTFGNVKFLNDAKEIKQNRILKLSKSKNELQKAYEDKIATLNKVNNEATSELQSKIIEQDNKIKRLEKQIDALKQKLEDDKNEYKRCYEHELDHKDLEIERLRFQLRKPRCHEGITEWVKNNLQGKLLFHDRAVRLMEKVNPSEVDLELLCYALEYLAYEYRDFRRGVITQNEMRDCCSKKYGRPFDVVPTKNQTIECYPKEYKIKYYIGYKGKPVESPLEWHLRVGNDNRNLLRIYFLYDKSKELVVVGSLPNHLSIFGYK